MKYAFDTTPIAVVSHLQSEPESLECRFEMVGIVPEERGSLDLLFLAEFT